MPGKLTEAQKALLARAIRNEGGVRVHGGREARSADLLAQRDLLRPSIPGYGSDYYITPAGRAALNKEGQSDG